MKTNQTKYSTPATIAYRLEGDIPVMGWSLADSNSMGEGGSPARRAASGDTTPL